MQPAVVRTERASSSRRRRSSSARLDRLAASAASTARSTAVGALPPGRVHPGAAAAPLLLPGRRTRPSVRRSGGASPRRARPWVLPEDCRDALPELAENSVALILTDPPYFTDRMGAEWDLRALRSRVKNGVVGGLPVGMKFDPKQGRDLYEFLRPIAEEWRRVLKPGGFALCFSHPRLAHRTTSAIEDAGFEIRDLLAWRHEGQAKAFTQEHFVRRRDLSDREKTRIIRALGGRKTPQLKPQMEMIVLAQAPREGTFVDNWLEYRAGLIDVSRPLLDPGRFPGTLIPCPKPKERFGHMTAKPVALLRHLIRIFSAPGTNSVVLDPFAGSGSTGVAARLEKRGFLGFEIDAAMAKTAARRVEEGEA